MPSGVGWDLVLAIALVSRWFARLWHVPNARDKSKHNLLKNVKGRLCYFVFSQSMIENCLPFFFETQICPGPIATNVYVCDVAGLEGK
jgi:hypothetical protein